MQLHFIAYALLATSIAAPVLASETQEYLQVGMWRAFESDSPNSHLESFNNDLQKHGIGGEFKSCSKLITVHVGSHDGNNSYGGLCLIDNGKTTEQLLVCNDEMLGRFQVKTMPGLEKLPTERLNKFIGKALAKFVESNCYGG